MFRTAHGLKRLTSSSICLRASKYSDGKTLCAVEKGWAVERAGQGAVKAPSGPATVNEIHLVW